MGRKRTSGVSHNKNSKTYKTTERQNPKTTSSHVHQSDITSFFSSASSNARHEEEVSKYFFFLSSIKSSNSVMNADLIFTHNSYFCETTVQFSAQLISNIFMFLLCFSIWNLIQKSVTKCSPPMKHRTSITIMEMLQVARLM